MCTAVQIIVFNLLRQWGVTPKAVVGHSSGEIAAAYACGSLTMKQAIVCAYMRGFFFERQTSPGAMASVGLGRDDIKKYIVDGVAVGGRRSIKK